MLQVFLNRTEEENIKNGYPWVFNNEVNHFEGEIKSGDVCSVLDYNGNFVGKGFFNANSKIMVRILTLKDEAIDEEFFKNRLLLAINHRRTLNFVNTCRLIFSEADLLPGLIVDKYADILVCQFSSLGMYKLKDLIVKLLIEILQPRGIFMRNDLAVNEKEGIPLEKGYLYNEFSTKITVLENDIKFYVDILDGQKTGYFLDQKLNRDYLKYYVKDKIVLDCFSHTGGFALHAAKYGAKKVVALDISQKACDDISANAKLNDFSNVEVCCADVFDYLRNNVEMNNYDLIILDPPAFTKSKETIKKAYKGYKDINLQALKRIKKGGYLFTFSCSQHMTVDLFFEMLREAIKDSRRIVQMVDFKIQAPDHPTLLNSVEQLYLKCVVLRVLE